MPDAHLEERLTKIESNLAQMEHLFDQLNTMVVTQGETLRRLQAAHSGLASTLENIELERIKNTNSRPPHWGVG